MANVLIVAFGGVSPEHEVSVLTGMQAFSALEERGHNVIPLYITKTGRWLTGDYLADLSHYEDLEKLEENGSPCSFTHDEMGKTVLMATIKKGWFYRQHTYAVDTVIPAFHGSEGENGAFQGICELFNLPYAGSNILASSIGMDKVKAKELCSAHEIPVVDGVDFWESEWESGRDGLLESIEKLGYPVVVKPVNLGSSIGVRLVGTRDELIEGVETAFRYDASLMVEQAVSPLMEINCSVLGTPDNCRTSVCERPLGKTETLSFEDKYLSGEGAEKGMASADREIPADIPDELAEAIQETSRKIFRLFRASGVARLDFLVNKETLQFYFNEINTIPGSFSFYLWEESGMEMGELMENLVEIARRRHRRKQGRIRSYETNLLSQKAVQGIKGLKSGKESAS